VWQTFCELFGVIGDAAGPDRGWPASVPLVPLEARVQLLVVGLDANDLIEAEVAYDGGRSGSSRR
jgi:hypothetical protein